MSGTHCSGMDGAVFCVPVLEGRDVAGVTERFLRKLQRANSIGIDAFVVDGWGGLGACGTIAIDTATGDLQGTVNVGFVGGAAIVVAGQKNLFTSERYQLFRLRHGRAGFCWILCGW